MAAGADVAVDGVGGFFVQLRKLLKSHNQANSSKQSVKRHNADLNLSRVEADALLFV